MTTGAPPRAAVDKHREALELARRRTALQVDTVAHAVTGLDDTVGWTRLTELGTASTVRAQTGAVTATTELLSATLDAAGMVADLADALPGIEPGRLASGRDVRGMFDRTRDIVQARMAGGAPFPEALDASANVLTAIASSEPHRIARDGQFNVGLSDNRFDRFRRVTVGSSCAFCRMLATRGAVYLTAESAGQSRRYHYKCDCYVELVVDPAAIEASKSTSGDWRNAFRDQDRLRAADVRREFADLSDDDLARLAGGRPDSALSADLLAERARRAAPPVSATDAPVVQAYIRDAAPLNMAIHEGLLDLDPNLATMAEDLRDAIAAAPRTNADVVVFRGLRKPPKEGRDFFKVGTVFTDPGFTSTSTDLRTARLFTVQTYALRIKVPKGTQAIIGSVPEQEILLQANTTFRVLGWETGGVTDFVDLEVVQP